MHISTPSTSVSFLPSTSETIVLSLSETCHPVATHLVVFQLSEVTKGKEPFPGFLPDVQQSREGQQFNCLPLVWRQCAQDRSQSKQGLVRLIRKYFLARWNNVGRHSSHLTINHGRCNPMRHITWALKGILWGGTVGLCSFARDLNNTWFCGKRKKKEQKRKGTLGLWQWIYYMRRVRIDNVKMKFPNLRWLDKGFTYPFHTSVLMTPSFSWNKSWRALKINLKSVWALV